MPFQNKTTLAYPATSTLPVQTWLDHRDPTNNDFRIFEIGNWWIDLTAQRAWIMVGKTVNSGKWIQISSSGTGILTITGNSGGAVSADGSNNINTVGTGPLTIVGNMGTNTLTVQSNGTLATTYNEDSGSAVPAAGILKIVGAGGITTSGGTNIVTITAGTTIPTTFTEDAGSAQPSGNILKIVGAGGISTSGATNVVTITPATGAQTIESVTGSYPFVSPFGKLGLMCLDGIGWSITR